MKTYKCKKITEAVDTLLNVSRSWGDDCDDSTCDIWYRGANNSAHDLLPSAYRKQDVDEYSPYDTFSQLVGNYMETRHYDDWDFYSLARHYGLPTRLLDWTEGIMQSIFFSFDHWDGKTTPCIWMICPHLLNKLTTNDEEIVSPPGSFSNMWLPRLKHRTNTEENIEYTNALPIAIYPRRSNPRIHGQQGVFTIHGTDKRPINTILCDETDSDNSIARIDLEGFDPQEVKRDLMYLGMHQAVIYPDADHLAADVRYMYKC